MRQNIKYIKGVTLNFNNFDKSKLLIQCGIGLMFAYSRNATAEAHSLLTALINADRTDETAKTVPILPTATKDAKHKDVTAAA